MNTQQKKHYSPVWMLLAVIAMVLTVLVSAIIDRPRKASIDLDAGSAHEGAAAVDLSMVRVEHDIRLLTAHDSRMTGSDGAAKALSYIHSELEHAGVTNITVQEFPTVAPVSKNSFMEARSEGRMVTVTLHPLWPNLARTCRTGPDGLVGRLIDVGGGTEPELQGKDLADAIVVMDWDSDLEWLSVPEFGGKAVVFRGNRASDGRTARRKFLSVPANIPRYYVTPADIPSLDAAITLKGDAKVFCDSEWKSVTGRNLVAELCPGSGVSDDPDQSPIVFHACYDSISVVPGLAPGAEQSCGAAVLLELARYFAQNPSPRPVHALFTGGHGQALAGMTHYVRAIREPDARQPGLMVGLDLSSHSESLGIFCLGHFRGQWEGSIRHKFTLLGSALADFARAYSGAPEPAAGETSSFIDGINLEGNRGWWSFFPYLAAFESELPTLAGIPGVTLATVNDDRRFVDTPDDTLANMELDMLSRQVLSRPVEHAGILGLARALAQWRGPFVSSPLADKLAVIRGRVVWLDQRRNYTPNEPLANATIFLKRSRGDKNLLGTRGPQVTMTDAEGNYAFDGLMQSWGLCTLEAYGTASPEFIRMNEDAVHQYVRVLQSGANVKPTAVSNAVLSTDGNIIYAVDMARSADYPWTLQARHAEQHASIVCFPCRSFSLLGLTDPRGYIPLTDVTVLNAATISPPFQFGRSLTDASPGDQSENLATVWTDPSLRILMTLGVGFQGKRLILVNNTLEDTEGKGFVIEELTTLPSMVLQGARDIWNLTESRVRKLERNGVNTPRVKAYHDESKKHIAAAEEALANHDYRGYRISSEKGWALESKAYGETLSMINNMIHGVLFYLALLLPLSYCLERLIVASETIRKRLTWIVVIFAASFFVLTLVHPAFRFTMTPLLVLLAFVILVLVVIVSVLIVGKMDAVLQARRVAATGRHEDQKRRSGIAVRALDLGMSNIRRRPQRGFLTGLSVVMVTFILLSFTSIVPGTSISRLKYPRGTRSYRGLLARDRAWSPLPDVLRDSLKRGFAEETDDSVVAARGWFFSDRTGQLSQIDLVGRAKQNDGKLGSATVPTLVCLEPDEPRVTGIDRSLVAGRWFESDDELGIILSSFVAEQLGYGTNDIGSPVRVFGEDLALTGIMDAQRFQDMPDIDGEPLTPVNFVLQQEMMAEAASSSDESAPAKPDTLEEYVHYPADQVAVVPFRYGQRLGATIRSVAVRVPDTVDVSAQAEGYARRSNLTVVGSDSDGVTLFAALNASQLSAAWQVVIPMFLGFVMILGTMLGSVYERQGEIFVYNSVGLSPTNVSSLFLAESAVYAIVGAGVGYLLGQISSKVLQTTGMLSGLTLNYTAGSTIFVTLLAMTMVFVSAIYPARRAFNAATADIEGEKGAETVDTEADTIAFYLPFVATAHHVKAMQAYLAEYLETIQGVTVGLLAVDNLQAVTETDDNGTAPALKFRAWMAPFDLGVSHDVVMRIVYRPDRGVHQYHLTATRFSGDRQNWHRLTPRFVTAIRKQILMWRVLDTEEYRKYEQRGEELFA
jgi:hypothetical protein